MPKTSEHVIKGRREIALLALHDGETIFAREVIAGCWDIRSDVQAAIAREKARIKAEKNGNN